MTLETTYDLAVPNTDPRWMTRRAAADLLGITERALDEHVRSERRPNGRIRRWKSNVTGAVKLWGPDVQDYKDERDAEPTLGES